MDDKIKLYHGSDNIVKKPLYGFGKETNDYGSGFYLTADKEKANAWAAVNGAYSTAYCNEYELLLDDLSVLNLDDCGVLSWIAEVLAHRGEKEIRLEYEKNKMIEMYKADTEKYDVIISYRADDSYMQVITSFLDGELSEQEVYRLFYEGELGLQYCLKSEKAFNSIQFINAKKVINTNMYMGYDENARKKVVNYLNNRRDSIKRNGFQPQGITIQKAIKEHYTYDKTYGFYQLDTFEESRSKNRRQNTE